MFRRKSITLPWVMTYSMLQNAGASLIWPLVTIYIHNYLHQSLTTSGATLLFMSLFMVIGNYAGGYLFDNGSAYRTSIIFTSLSTIAIIALICFHDWPIFALLLMPVSLGDGVNLTLANSYATAIVHKSRRYIFNIMYIGLNLGIVIGTAMVGFLLKRGIAFLFTVTACFYIALIIMIVLRFNVNLSATQSFTTASRANKSSQNTLLVALICGMVFCIYLSYSVWDSVISIHMTNLGMSFVQYSWIWVVNGIMIVLGQALINRVFGKLRITLQITIGIIIFSISFWGLIPAHHYLVFVISMAVLTLGEMISLPDIPAWIDDFAERGEQGRYQAYFNVFMTTGRAVGPLFDGIIVEGLGYPFLFGFSGIIVLISLALVMLNVRHRSLMTKKG